MRFFKSKSMRLAAILSVIIFIPGISFAADNIDDVMVYRGGADTSIPVYRPHDDGGFESAATAQDITSVINFIKVLSKPGNSSAEKFMCTKDSANDVDCQIFNGVSWGNLLEVSTNAGAQKGYDIAYEQISGEAMACYRSPAINTQTPRCRLWNGSSWGAEFSALAVGGAIDTVRMISDPGSDYIAMITKDGGDDVNVQIWNGSSWGNLQEVSTGAGNCTSCLPYDGSWEKNSGDFQTVWFDDGADALYSRKFDKSSLWAAQITGVVTGLSTSDNVYVETDASADPTGNGVLAAVIDDDNTLNANYWNGSSWGTPVELSAAISGSVAANTHLLDLAFEQRPDYDAVLIYGSATNALRYRVWDSAMFSWGLEQTLPIAVESKDWLQLAADPNRQNIMLTTVGTVNDVDSIEWGGTSWDANWTSHDTGSDDVNWNAWYAYDDEDEDHTPPTAIINGAAQKNDGTGLVDVSVDVSDNGLHPNRLKIEYETDAGGACDGPWANATLVGPATADVNDGSGAPNINNASAYQVGSGAGTRIMTYAGANTITFDWDSSADLPSGNASYCLRATANDDEVDSDSPGTSVLTIDNVAPTGLAGLIDFGSSATVQHLDWTTVTETNFNHYEIWYGTNQSDVQNRTGTALKWDATDFLAMATQTTHHTHISGLTPATTHYFKIWAVDDYGNEQTVADISATTDPAGDIPPTASSPVSISQALDGSGWVTFSTTVYDVDFDAVEMRVRFSPDGGTTFYNAYVQSATVTPGDLVPDDAFSIDNGNDFQIGHSDHISLNASSRHPVRLTVVWNSKSPLNQNGGLGGQAVNVIIRVTSRDDNGEIGIDYDSAPFALDNAAPVLSETTPVPAGISDLSPDYSFSSTAAGFISYGGSCASSDTTASSGANTVTFDLAPAAEGSYANCTITVTDSLGNQSNALAVSSFIIDVTAPAGLVALVAGTAMPVSQALSWTAVTETNFNHYEIWYGTNQSDVQNRTGTALEWDNADDAGLATRTTANTVITGLAPSSSYYYKIWAVDVAAQETTVPDINVLTPANSKPLGSISSIVQATDGSRDVEVLISVSDANGDKLRAKIEYETTLGGSCSGPWAFASLSGPVTADFEDVSGPPDTSNAAYRLGSGTGTAITTALGTNGVQFQWDTLNDLPMVNSQVVCLRLTANDSLDDQNTPHTFTATVDMVTPTVTAAKIVQQLTADAANPGVAEYGDVVLFTWDNSALGDANADVTSVSINLENYGGSAAQTMYDDGTHGDVLTGDKVYSFALTLETLGLFSVSAHPHVTATDAFGNTTVTAGTVNMSVDTLNRPQLGGSGWSGGLIAAPSDAYSPSAALAENPTIDIDKGLSISGVATGELIKGAAPAVYYKGRDGKRYVFGNDKVYFSWFKDFSEIRFFSAADLAAIPIGGNVTYRPGSRLVKIQSDPRVYAVARGGVLRPLPDERRAREIFGDKWNMTVEDIPESFFVNYKIGTSL